MNKKQREHIKYLLDTVLHESDRWEARAERREAEGNMEKVKHCEEKIDICSAKLDMTSIRIFVTISLIHSWSFHSYKLLS